MGFFLVKACIALICAKLLWPDDAPPSPSRTAKKAVSAATFCVILSASYSTFHKHGLKELFPQTVVLLIFFCMIAWVVGYVIGYFKHGDPTKIPTKVTAPVSLSTEEISQGTTPVDPSPTTSISEENMSNDNKTPNDAPQSAADRLRILQQLYEEELVTKYEYDKKRADILEHL